MTDKPEAMPRRIRSTTPRLLRGGPDGGNNGGMPPDLDIRAKALEARTSEIGLDVSGLIKDVAEIKGKISQMPTTFRCRLGSSASPWASSRWSSRSLAPSGRRSLASHILAQDRQAGLLLALV